MVQYEQSKYYTSETKGRIEVCVIVLSNASTPRPFTLEAVTEVGSSGTNNWFTTLLFLVLATAAHKCKEQLY